MDALQKYKIIRPHLEEAVSIRNLSTQFGISIRTLNRWIKQYREKGFIGLERKTRFDKETRRRITEELEEIIKALALQKPKLSIATIQRKIEQIAISQKKERPTYNIVYDIVNKINPSLMTLAHEGSTVYRDQYELVFLRESAYPNSMWQIDHSPLDILLLNEKEEAQKPWVTIIEDDYSRAIPGFFVSFDSPCAVNTALALRQAIWRKQNPDWQVCGIPEIIYTDNGSDFISEHIEKVCATLKIRLINTIPGRPQGKGKVERFFLTLSQSLLQRLPGYAPSGTAKKVKAILSLAEFSKHLEKFILEQYHKTPHSTTKQAPLNRWEGDGFLPQMPHSLEQLDFLLMTVPKKRKIHRKGIFFKGFRYMSTLFAGFVGEEVIIRYDPRDLAEVRVFLDGAFLCNAICQEIAGQVISLKEIRKARQKQKRCLRKQINDAKQLLENLEKGEPTPKEPIIKTSKRNRLKLYYNE